MKKVKIGKLDVSVCETLDDIGMKRWIAVRQQIWEAENSEQVDDANTFYAGILNAYDQDSKSGILIKIHDNARGLKNIKNGIDSYQWAFAAITFLPDEDRMSTDVSWFEEKIAMIASEKNEKGLPAISQGEVRKYVENFTKRLSQI